MAQTVPQVRQLVFNGEDIGMGFNSDTGLAVGTALDFDPPSRDPGQEGTATATIVTSHESLMESIGMSASAEGHYAFVASGSLKVKFSNTTNYNASSTFVVAQFVINNETTRGRNFRVKPAAQQLLDSNRIDEFNRAFGDSFVRGQLTGGEYYAVMRITSTDSTTQTNLAVTLQADFGNPAEGGSFQGELDKANKVENSHQEFSVVFYQRGGAGAEQIGATLSVDDVKARLKSLPDAVKNNPFPYQIEVATYDTVPVLLPPKEQQDDFLLALADADRQKLLYLQKRNDFDFAVGHPEYFDNPPTQQVMQEASSTYLQAANGAIAFAVKLSRGEINPPQLFDPSKLSPPIVFPTITLVKKDQGLERNFTDWFFFKDDPSTLKDDKTLIDAIAAVAIPQINDFANIKDPGGDPAKTLALQAKAVAAVVNTFASFTLGFSFERPGVNSIGHLGTMLPLSITELNFADNKLLIDLRGIEKFPNLTTLDLSQNRIGDITPIASLKSLESLTLSFNNVVELAPISGLTALTHLVLEGNKIADLTPLQNCTNLEDLAIGGNNITDLSPLKALTNLKALTLRSILDPKPNTPYVVATGLGAIPRIANPLLLANKVSVRVGRLPDGPPAQFTGSAERIGQTNRFAVHLTRAAETRDDEWEFVAIGPDQGFFLKLDPGTVSIVVFSKNDGVLYSMPVPGDPTKLVMDPNVTFLDGITMGGSKFPNSFDAVVAS